MGTAIMNSAVLISIALAFVVASASVPAKRQKRQFFEEQSFVQEPLGLSSGALDLLGNVQSSFFCGNQTVFDQSVLTCVHLQDSIPCGDSANYYFRNEEFGIIPPPARF